MPLDVSVSFIIAASLMTYFFVGGVLFSARSLLFGRYIDPELQHRGSSAVLILLLRHYFAWLMQPPLFVLSRCKVPPNAVTGVSVLLAIAAGISAAVGDFALSGWLYLASGFCDFLDGRLARILGQVTQSGAMLDSTLDRYSEAAMLMGMAWFYRDTWVLFVFLLFLTGSFLVPYVRARGEALGIESKIGLMQRPERVVVLGLASWFSPILEFGYPAYAQSPLRHSIVVVAAIFLAVTTQLTAAYRLWHLIAKVNEREEQSTSAGSPWSHVTAFLALSCAEFAVFVLLNRQLDSPPWSAAISICLSALVIFFAQRRTPVSPSRIAAVVGAGVLMLGMMAVLAWIPVLDSHVSWLLSRAAVTLAWIYPLWLSMKAQ
jgi:phosphatidylglycerophosphate synthase